MSRFQKGILALVIALVAVIAVGYAGMRYLENSVAEAVRAWAASTSGDFRVSFGDVRYSFKDNTLFLDKSNFTYKNMGETTVVNVDSLQIQGIGDSFLELLKDPKAQIKEPEFLVANELVAKGIDTETVEQGPGASDTSVAAPAIFTKAHLAQRTISNIRMKTELGKELFSSSDQDVFLKVLYAVAYSKGTASDCTVTMNYDQQQAVVTAKNYTESNVGYGRVDSVSLKEIDLTVENASIMSLDSMTLKDMNLPAMPVMLKIMEAGNSPEQLSEAEAQKLIRDFFTSSGRPLCGEFALNGLKLSLPTLETVSLASFRIVNPSISPFAMDISMEHLVLPLTLDPQLQTLRLAGFENMDLTSTLSFTAPDTSDRFKVSGSLNLAQGGTLDMLLEGNLSTEEWEKFSANTQTLFEDDMIGAMGVFFLENMKVIKMEMGYADEGLLPRSIKLTQLFMGLSPEQSLDLLRQQLSLMALDMGDKIPDAEAKLTSFVDHPGAIRLSITPSEPASLAEFETDPNIPVSLDVTPGPKSIEELVKALQ